MQFVAKVAGEEFGMLRDSANPSIRPMANGEAPRVSASKQQRMMISLDVSFRRLTKGEHISRKCECFHSDSGHL